MSDHHHAGLRALLSSLPADTRGELVRMYGRSIASHLDLIGLRPGSNSEPLAVALHGLGGSAAMMQDRELSQHARGMEGDLRAGRVEQAWARWPDLQAHARRTLALLDSLDL